jgi:outer membrane protein OmpA-like peptidoglycan-associated protein
MQMVRIANVLRLIVLIILCASMATFSAAHQQQGSAGNIINITVSRTVPTVNYMSRGSTKVDFLGTALLPRAEGDASIQAKNGVLNINANFKGLTNPGSFGNGYLVYVMWAITPEGRTTNLGQLVLDDDKSKLQVTTRLQTFGLIVTAEPYFAVSFPSEDVILANSIRSDTKGSIASVNANFELLQRGKYASMNLTPFAIDPNVPLDLLQARNAVRIAQLEGSAKFAPDSFAKAQQTLTQAETYQTSKNKKEVSPAARAAVQAAEDARTISVKREEADRVAAAKSAQEAQTKAAQDAEAQQRAQAQQSAIEAAQAKAAQEAEATQRAQAEVQKLQAEKTAAQDAQARAQAETERAAAQADAQRQQAAAAQAEQEKQALRAKLLEQFNRVLPTRDTPRGLVVNMGDVLFETGKADLNQAAREALARLSGVVSNYPSLHLSIEGHTDSTGSPDFNQKLSEKRANGVRDFLITQGLSADSLVAIGLGQDNPVADNSTAAGRQQNRRVEIIISGEVIGTKIGGQ